MQCLNNGETLLEQDRYMEPVTAIVMAAEMARKAKQAYNVLKEMKNVAEYEGKDQLQAICRVASSANKLPSKEVKGGEKKDISVFVEKMPSSGETLYKLEVFDDSIPQTESSSPSEQIGVNTIAFQSDDIPQQESVPSKGATVERSSEVAPRENAETDCQVQEIPESQPSPDISEGPEQKKEGLTDEQKKEVKEKTGWSGDIVNAIRTMDEAQVYMDAGLEEGKVNEKSSLLQPNIDGKACNEPKWPDWSNKDLAKDGYPPRDKTGTPYELHHIGQNPNSPLAELTYEQHHCNGNFKKLHTFEESSIDRQQFNKERKEYWQARSQTI